MGHIENNALFPTYAKYPISLVRGVGSRLWDDQGKEYLDFMAGVAVCNLGHVPVKVKQRIREQLDQVWHVSNLFHIPSQEKLAQLLVKHSCMDHVFFCNSGAEANEAAIKCARRYHKRVLENKRYEIITFEKSFHGRTMATLTATGQDKVKDGFFPLPQGFKYARFNDLQSVKEQMNNRTAAIMIELVQGEGGVYPAEPEFVAELSALCKEHGVLLIIDEVQTGMGRTGNLFAYEHYGIDPDIITLAKGLASGFPIGVMMGKQKNRDAFSVGSHGSTFGGAPLSATAGLATLEMLLEERITEHAAQVGAYALQRLKNQLKHYPIVQTIRGIGLLIGIECREPIAPIIQDLLKEGLLVLAASTHVIRLVPSLLITKEEIDQAVALIERVLKKY
jgi:acetylornithine aminotransferase